MNTIAIRASDELSCQIEARERELNDRNTHLCAWLEDPILTVTEIVESDDNEVCFVLNHEYGLGYGEHQGKWAFLVSWLRDAIDEDPNIMFLRDAPHNVRLRALGKIPEIIELLDEESGFEAANV